MAAGKVKVLTVVSWQNADRSAEAKPVNIIKEGVWRWSRDLVKLGCETVERMWEISLIGFSIQSYLPIHLL